MAVAKNHLMSFLGDAKHFGCLLVLCLDLVLDLEHCYSVGHCFEDQISFQQQPASALQVLPTNNMKTCIILVLVAATAANAQLQICNGNLKVGASPG